ncbi:hypothetical protein HMPREF9950_0168 [Streptococcus oralis SK313]|uniref:Uncharacterized protein n=1 Tax=Streptococcus oralis SK313 TaxID=1035190 RepID=F9Q0E1_STROR|nr:hypothetical protein HMPREF9950_0168 [Streptococcus oralis SK313]
MEKGKGANFLKPAFANILGAIICYAIVLILLLFRLGDIWPFFPIILVLTFLFLSIHSHYQKVAKQLRLYEGIEKRTYDGNLVLVLVGNVTRVSVGAINYAQSIGDEVLAMHISTKETAEKDQEILQEFADYFPNITLKNINTSYRDIITPSVKYVKRIAQEAKQKTTPLQSLSHSLSLTSLGKISCTIK